VLEHLQPGVPGIPAHLLIGADRGWPGYREALSRFRTVAAPPLSP
jgi:hypothetical protein